jgi:hypothetical protein
MLIHHIVVVLVYELDGEHASNDSSGGSLYLLNN